MNRLSRRKIIQSLSILPFPLSSVLWSKPSEAAGFADKFLMTVQTDGAWDVTLFCDPKENTTGEKEITHWSNDDISQEVGNLKYAPFAGNEAFFQKHHKDILVINGVDSQTNAHSIGVTNNWSGRLAAGYPSLPTLFAGVYGSSLPLPYLNFGGGYSYTANQLSAVTVGNPGDIKDLLLPNRDGWNGNIKVDPDLWQLIKAENMASLNSQIEGLSSPESIAKRSEYIDAFSKAERLSALGSKLPTNEQLNQLSELQKQILVSLSAFAANTTITADIVQGGYDTHENKDCQQSK